MPLGCRAARQDEGVEVLGSRILLRPSEPERSRRFYRDTLGLEVYREFGHPDDPGLVFFLGGGFLEVSGRSTHAPGNGLALWIQVRDMKRSVGGCWPRECPWCAAHSRSPGGWWRCGSRIRRAYELFVVGDSRAYRYAFPTRARSLCGLVGEQRARTRPSPTRAGSLGQLTRVTACG
jgi:hypothetical protein